MADVGEVGEVVRHPRIDPTAVPPDVDRSFGDRPNKLLLVDNGSPRVEENRVGRERHAVQEIFGFARPWRQPGYDLFEFGPPDVDEIGRASCRERV